MGADNTYGETSFNPEKLSIPTQVLKTDTVMKTALFCTSYITPESQQRYQQWIDFYYQRMKDFGADCLFIIDDAGSFVAFDPRIKYTDESLKDFIPGEINLLSFFTHLGRHNIKDYPGWWRSFTFMIKIAQKYGFEKLIHIESDFYVLSDRMKRYINNLSSGWIAFYSKHYNFPETGIQIICKDRFLSYELILENAQRQNYNFGRIAEYELPFSNIEKKFEGDRLGEPWVLQGFLNYVRGGAGIDYAGQVSEEVPVGKIVEMFGVFGGRI